MSKPFLIELVLLRIICMRLLNGPVAFLTDREYSEILSLQSRSREMHILPGDGTSVYSSHISYSRERDVGRIKFRSYGFSYRHPSIMGFMLFI